jgi:hypothetical protein
MVFYKQCFTGSLWRGCDCWCYRRGNLLDGVGQFGTTHPDISAPALTADSCRPNRLLELIQSLHTCRCGVVRPTSKGTNKLLRQSETVGMLYAVQYQNSSLSN